MSTYIHHCQKCPRKAEATYSMSFVGEEQKLPKKLLQQITCKKHGLMPRVPQVPTLKGTAGGQTLTSKQLVARDKPKRKLRSRLHFKNDVLPTLDKRTQKRLGRKWAHIKGDHEKIKI